MSKDLILGVDIGYGDVKVVIGTTGQITHQFKFSSAIAIATRTSAIRDVRILELTDQNGKTYDVYAGADALNLPSNSIVDITNYQALETFAPVFIFQALKIAEVDPKDIKVLVSGLSVTQLDQSGYFKERIKNFTVNGQDFQFENVYLLPQGAGSKMAFDKYGANYPNIRTESTQYTFVGCDIGFNTLDLFYVTDGKTSPNLFEGLAGEGVMKIAQIVKETVKELYQRDITLREAKQVLDTKIYKLRGQSYDMSEVVRNAIKKYTEGVMLAIEERYGPVIDKCDFICLQGGGAALFDETTAGGDSFFRVVRNSPDFYNAIGFYLYGVGKV